MARRDLAVKLDAEIVTKAKHVVVSRRGKGAKITIAEYLSGLLKDLVNRDYEAELGQEKRPKAK